MYNVKINTDGRINMYCQNTLAVPAYILLSLLS